MSHSSTIRSLPDDPEGLEQAYRQAVRDGAEAGFAEAVEAGYAESPGSVLLAAWHYRLAAAAAQVKGRAIAWGWALPLAAANGLLLWLLSDEARFSLHVVSPLTGRAYPLMPAALLLAAPISAALIALFLTLAGRRSWGRALAAGLGLAACTAYALLLAPRIGPRPFQEQYLYLMVLHLGLLAWAGAGLVALARRTDRQNRFAVLAKSLEVFVAAGLLAVAGGILTAVTFALFAALGIEMPKLVWQLFVAGGGGLIAVLAVALVYDPRLAPAQQPSDEGLSRVVALLLRLLLPLAVVVLLVYVAFIPFNWREPFEHREVLLAYNAMLFAVVALLMAVTPVHAAELSEKVRTWVRRGVIALAALALLISLYALAAILYRTALDRLTPNRLLFIGWDVVNIALLAAVLIGQARAGRPRWLQAMHAAFAAGIVLYAAWSLVGLLAPPWLFRGDAAAAAGLPAAIQVVMDEQAEPIVLQCAGSPHIYLLQDGRKRWIRDIPTFEAEGYAWQDVLQVSCGDLAGVPDGETIPPGSGPPPEP